MRLEKLAAPLFHIFRCTTSDAAGKMMPRHGYGDAKRFLTDRRRFFLWEDSDLARSLAHLRSDPVSFKWIRDVDKYVLSNTRISEKVSAIFYESPAGLISDVYRLEEARATDCFSRLSQDILYHLANHVSTLSLAKLRLASRSVAAQLQPTQLPQAFWASRFWVDFRYEMSFCFAGCPELERLSLPPIRNWRVFYAVARMSKRQFFQWGEAICGPDTLVILHRRHIRNVLASIADPLLSLLRMPETSWCAASSGDPPGSIVDPKRHGNGPVVRIHWTRRPESLERLPPFQFNVYQWGLFHLAKHMSKRGIELTVSLITFDGFRYISGFTVKYGSSDDANVTRAGVYTTDSFDRTQFAAGDEILELHVYSRVDGVVGLVFTTVGKDGDERELTNHSLGLCDVSDSEVGVAVLNPGPGNKISGLGLAFDVS